jgi:hypothetical protein
MLTLAAVEVAELKVIAPPLPCLKLTVRILPLASTLAEWLYCPGTFLVPREIGTFLGKYLYALFDVQANDEFESTINSVLLTTLTIFLVFEDAPLLTTKKSPTWKSVVNVVLVPTTLGEVVLTLTSPVAD